MYMDKKYLSELRDYTQMKKNTFLIAPTGAGKTHLIFDHVIHRYNGKILYLCDNNNLERQVYKNPNVFSRKRSLDDEVKKDSIILSEKVELMCYSYFAKKIYDSTGEDIGQTIISQYDLIICDEIHNLIDYQRFDDKNELRRLIELLLTYEYKDTDILIMTATPQYVYKFKEHNPRTLRHFDIVDFSESKEIKRYINKRIGYINHMNQIKNCLYEYREGFQYGGLKTAIFTQKIEHMKKIEEICKELGLKPICIWSSSNKEKMSKEQEDVRNHLLQTGYLLEPYNCLIYNRATETGVNIRDEKIDLMICNTSNETLVVQSRGRIRHDVELLIVRSNDCELVKDYLILFLHEKWLNVPLTKKDRDSLCKELQLYDNKGKLIKRPGVKKTLEKNGYTVRDIKTVVEGKRSSCNIIVKNPT